jgi:hypothetical protein
VSEATLLRLVAVQPHPAALARRLPAGALFVGLRRLERSGLVTRRGGLVRVTARGRSELALDRTLRAALARALAA